MYRPIIFLILISGLSLQAAAAPLPLIDRGNGLIFDPNLNVTWLQNADLTGPMNWVQATTWVESLVFAGFDDWRLPSVDVNGDQSETQAGLGIVDCATVSESECRDNELGYMYYVNLAGSGADLSGDQGLFMNIQFGQWSGTEFAPFSPGAWAFQFNIGELVALDKLDGTGFGAWAVRDGDVAGVSTPGTSGLVGLGLAVAGWLRRRSRQAILRT